MLQPRKTISSDHEALFIERYDRLLAWGLQLTEHNNDLAEDILHDAFIQFTLTPPNLQTINNVDAYLYGMLRNLHLSQMRRATRSRFQQLSIVDYESAVIGLHAADPRAHIQVQEELRRVCHYACARKESSRAGSVLILRFFHGYYPSEISRILQCTRLAVDLQIKRARTEARAFLEKPETLSFIHHEIPEIRSSGFARTPDRFSSELRELIFSTRAGNCFRVDELRKLYKSDKPLLFESKQLAHVVSCPTCLDTVNRLLDLPLLKERYAMDTLGNDPSSKGGRGGSGGPPSSGGAISRTLRRWKRDARDAFEHKPQELCISVNGYLQGSQRISSDINEQSLTIDMDERIGFVEVFSEQGIRLLLLNVDEAPPEGPGEQHLRAQLSDTRTLDLSLRFSSPWPTLHVVYTDPTLKQLPELEGALEGEDLQSLSQPHNEVDPIHGSTVSEGFEVKDLVEHEVSIGRGSRWVPEPLGTWLSDVLDHLRYWRLDFASLSRPSVVTALVGLILAVTTLFVYKRVPVASVSVADLLQRSMIAEESVASRPDQVLHRSINLEERRVGQSASLISRRRLDLWESRSQSLKALRVFDERNQLVNGEWAKGDASRLILHHGAKLQSSTVPKPSAVNITFADVWQLVPSAQQFSVLINSDQNSTVIETATEYTIAYQRYASEGLQRATLVLSRPELRPIRQTLLVKQGDELREYVFSESSFEQRSATAVAPAVFEPDPQLLSSAQPETGNSKTEITSPNRPEPPTFVAASPEFEMEVIQQLNQANAFLGEQIGVERTPEGQLRVKGVVETDERKSELLQALKSARTNPAVKIDIVTVAEALKRQKQSSSGPVNVEHVEASKNQIPVDAELRQYLSKRGIPNDRLDQEVQRFSQTVLSHSFQARRHALALKQIAERFSLDDLRNLDSQAKTSWRGMLAQHARSVQQEIVALRKELDLIFSVPPSSSDMSVNLASDEDLVRVVGELFTSAVAIDDSMRRSFAVYATNQGSAAVKTSQFWQSLVRGEQLARSIQLSSK